MSSRAVSRAPLPDDVLVPSAHELTVDHLHIDRPAGRIVIHVSPVRTRACCPTCGRRSTRVRSYYTRHLADLPWQGFTVCLEVTTRKFVCPWRTCPRKIFTERFPETTVPYGRRTQRAGHSLTSLGLTLGGRPAARLATQLGLVASTASILRQLRQIDPGHPAYRVTSPTPRVLGVDDWAWKKRQVYGTLLCDLETHRVIDLLPDRSTETFAQWLRAHPGIEFISRDRGGEYALAATQAAPHAIQIADRFHLLQNVTDAMTGALTGHLEAIRTAYRQACEHTPPASGGAMAARRPPMPRACPHNGRSGHRPPRTRRPAATTLPASPVRMQQRQARHTVRQERFTRAHELHAQHAPITRIAREIGVCARTIRRWLRSDRVLDWSIRRTMGQRRTRLDTSGPPPPPGEAPSPSFHEYVRGRIGQGCLNARQLERELRAMGYTGSYAAVRRVVAARRPAPGVRAPRVPSASAFPPSPKETTWLLRRATRQDTEHAPLTPLETLFVQTLREIAPPIAEADALRLRFETMCAAHDYNALRPWLHDAEHSLLKRFAQGVRRDFDAVLAALCFPWSQGQTEGQVNRLKAIKRSMYGRCGFQLLRQRVLQSAA